MERENSQPSKPEQAAGNATQLSEERYRDLVEGINHGIVWEADTALQFSMVSRQAEQILGYPLSQWYTEPDFWINHLHPDDREQMINLFRRVSQGDQSGDHRFIAADARIVWLHTGVHLAHIKKMPVYRGLSMDVTYLKATEQELKQKIGELEEVNRQKSELLSVASHEMRTSLNTILGYSAQLNDPKMTQNAAQKKRIKNRIYENAKAMMSLINQLLDMSKIDSGKMAIDLQDEPVHLPELLDQIIGDLQFLADEKGLTINRVADPGYPPILSDPGKLRQIFTNLIANAIKFTDQGAISIRIYHHVQERRVSVEMSDTGIGIPEDRLKRIFEPYYQINPSAHSHSTGLGLLIVKKLVESLNGSIYIRSKPGAGSTFTVRLPYDSI